MKIYHFPALTLNRLVRESVSGFYLRKIKFPDADRPFTALNPATMPWPELQGLLLAHLRHRYTSYEADLRAGADRDQLHREIHAAAFHAFPFLRSDPRPFEPDPPRLAMDEAAARLADLKDLEHGFLETRSRLDRSDRAGREAIDVELAALRANIRRITEHLTKPRVSEEGVVCSFSRVMGGDYDWLGHSLSPNHLAYAGFKCPGCGRGVYRSKRPLSIGTLDPQIA
jgi:hypothetical protein